MAEKSAIAFARVRQAGIRPERLVAIYLATVALLQEDALADRDPDYRITQLGKAVHRLASGTHYAGVRRPSPGEPRSKYGIKRDVYPRSAGLVLRRMGGRLAAACSVLDAALPEIVALKEARFGLHPTKRSDFWREFAKRQRF